MFRHSEVMAIVIVSLVTLATTYSSFGQPDYYVIDLGTLGGNDSEARGVNADGVVSGWSDVSNGDDHAFVWDEVSMLDLGTLGGQESNARAVSQSLVVVGRADYDFWFQEAFRWTGGSGMVGLGTLGGPESSAYDVNGIGQIVGWSDTNTGARHAFLWQNNAMTDLGTLGGVSSWGRGINSQGDVAGYSYILGGLRRAFLYTNNSMNALDTLGGPESFGYAINDSKTVVGESDTAGGPSHACAWFNGGSAVDLGTLGGLSSEAWDVNNHDQIVGMADNASGNNRAFLWDDGDLFSLNDLVPSDSGWNLKEARSINDNGEIAGRGNFGGQTRAFLLVPSSTSRLIFGGPTPGEAGQQNQFRTYGATAGKRSTFTYGLARGSSAVPGCPGVFLVIQNAKSIGTATADADGVATLSLFVPGGASGLTVLFQAYEADSCRTSNHINFEFP